MLYNYPAIFMKYTAISNFIYNNQFLANFEMQGWWSKNEEQN